MLFSNQNLSRYPVQGRGEVRNKVPNMFRIEGVSPNIDSCGRMIAKKALSAYRRIGAAHQRWIDPEDLLQEGLIAALTVEKKFSTKGGSKFSSYLFTGLDWRGSQINAALAQPKRFTKTDIVEIDKPLPDDSGRSYEIPTEGRQGKSLNLVASFVSLCRAVSQDAIIVLVRGLLFADNRRATPELCSEIKAAALKLGIGMDDLLLIGRDETTRKKLLQSVSKDVIMGLDTDSKLRCLECVECEGEFTVGAIREGRFFVSTMTCATCHGKMQQASPSESCFGKAKRPDREGYSKADVECRLHCPDRKVCRKFVKGELPVKNASKAAAGTATAVDDVDFSEVEPASKENDTKKKTASVKKGKTEKKGKVKAEKKAKTKAEKAPKEPKVDPDPPPKGLAKWPYKAGSMMRFVLSAMLEGVDKKKIQKQVEDSNFSWSLMLGIMRRQKAKKGKFTWKLSEEGDRYKITDLKQHK